MYQILLDDKILYYPGDSEYVAYNAVVKLKVGQAGSCEFIVPPINPLYASIYNRKSMVSVYRGDALIFNGEVRESSKDKNNCKKVYAVGELAFLMDSIQPQYNYGNVTPTAFMTAIIDEHNSQVEARKQFTLGYSSVQQGYDESNKVTDFDDSLTALRENLVDTLGGCLRVRHAAGVRYLDFVPLSSYGEANTQGINFGENLLDYAENMTASDIATEVIPLGARLEDDGEFEKRLDITSVNNGKNYLASTSAVNSFGHVRKIVVFDGIEDASTLKTAGKEWLTENQYETLTLKVSAVDLSMLDSSLDEMNLGDRISCYAEPYGLDITLPIQEQTLNLMAPQKDTIVLSATIKNKKQTISGQVGTSANSIKQATYKQEQKIRAVIAQEAANLMATFTGSMGGYKLSEFDSNGLWIRDLYMDTPDKTTATNILEISMRGIRSSTSGYKAPTDPAWKLGITIDGQINADRILTGTLMAGLIKAGILSDVGGNTSFNLETGALTSTKFSINSTNFTLTESGIASMTGATINDGSVVSKSGNKKATIENGFYRGYLNNQISGLLDLCPTYDDNKKRAALWGKDELLLQAGGSAGAPTHEVTIDKSGLYTDKKIECGSIVASGKITCGSVVPANGATNNISWKQSNGLDVSITVKNGIITAINKTEPAPDPT